MSQANDRISRKGYTLSEMLVVLSVLVTVTALSQPALREALSDSRLRSAAKQVRVELAKTRLKAMKSGVALQFRYKLGQSRFEIAPTSLADGHGRAGARIDRDRQRDETTDPVLESVVEQDLPQGVSFELEDQGDVQAVAAVSEDGWSDPIVFYPNGRTENAHIRLKGEHRAFVEVSLRGLTGVATASKPRHEEELR
ncbi:MAG: prepilin-type N-terminal cleavage/methylation domain-containing protein [Planctomycetia bacterium]|nr:prepilin-type N-terminal cleavage/methylation domain-containing protein [Planctomycetia bacterium]